MIREFLSLEVLCFVCFHLHTADIELDRTGNVRCVLFVILSDGRCSRPAALEMRYVDSNSPTRLDVGCTASVLVLKPLGATRERILTRFNQDLVLFFPLFALS